MGYPPQPSQEPSLDQRIADLELALAQSRATSPLGSLPTNGAGVGEEVAETWSQQDQEMANRGEHPDQ